MEGKVKAVAKELNNNGIHFETKLQQEEESVTQEIQVKCDDKISEEEKNKICLMRALVEKQDPSSKEVDDFEIRRFLRARDLDVDKATAMLLKCLKWKKNIAPNGSISASEIPNQIAHNKMFMQGVDKQGRPIAVILGARHFHNKLGFVVFALDKLCSRTSPSREKFVVIADLQGFGYANSDARAYIGALSILQDCYPERLEKLILVHVPYLFWTMWKIVCPFIDNKTKKKITFVENKRLMTTLLEDIDESQLPEFYGGEMPLVPIHEA
ncbi:PREDICTED: random slug protein 5-like isoform X2 [Nicotiana attenuata]|uniref:random slug protein 5-like isoform X2 n=1 Tax=Nicotiana attenuata TaxID=49451 RepID=UPI000904F64D|nr:PREDICTED: random slug protein 5-like isoform X2 [Nicotiana attenuata]